MTTKERFAQEYGMPLDQVYRLVQLSEMYFKYNERACNGDYFTSTRLPSEKELNMALWSGAVDTCSRLIRELVLPYGFTDVVSTGLGPTLKRGERFVEIPY